MREVDPLIRLIRDGRDEEALATLNASPALATARSDQSGAAAGNQPDHFRIAW